MVIQLNCLVRQPLETCCPGSCKLKQSSNHLPNTIIAYLVLVLTLGDQQNHGSTKSTNEWQDNPTRVLKSKVRMLDALIDAIILLSHERLECRNSRITT